MHWRLRAYVTTSQLRTCVLAIRPSRLSANDGDSAQCPPCQQQQRIRRCCATVLSPAIAMRCSTKTCSSLSRSKAGIVLWPGEQASSASPGRRVGASVGMVRRATWAHIFTQSPRLHKSAQKKPNVAITSASMSRRRAIQPALLHPSPLRRVVMRHGAATARPP
ncbi:hypothetical protein J3E71DRAFT_237674 [Bipolaris maydis]|nr:hypothetical protein J3E73DRAFT_252667 [Bipolaris maydis]KAJ6284675.1 hypothetical protein J3E71DRAFT_237674 [Bipolaris maydis]